MCKIHNQDISEYSSGWLHRIPTLLAVEHIRYSRVPPLSKSASPGVWERGSESSFFFEGGEGDQTVENMRKIIGTIFRYSFISSFYYIFLLYFLSPLFFSLYELYFPLSSSLPV